MKCLIADYPHSMMQNHDNEKKILLTAFPDCEIVVYQYADDQRQAFYEQLADADALLTAFIKIDHEALEHAPELKVISMNATGYDNVDLEAAKAHGIGVCAVGEYCTTDVAEFAITLLCMLVKKIKGYTYDIEYAHRWRYDVMQPNVRLQQMTLGILGFGKIGKAIAIRAKALGLTIYAYDPYVSAESGRAIGISLVDEARLLKEADLIINVMNFNPSNVAYFNHERFKQMTKKPYIINLARGGNIVETDLIDALEQGVIKGAALDVLADETPDLANHPLVGRENVIITPHAAFYSQLSIESLQRFSTENIVYYLQGKQKHVFKLIV